ncbi:MAG: rhodanese-like domain-containing protein [Thermodesulfobacteriota bacterium]
MKKIILIMLMVLSVPVVLFAAEWEQISARQVHDLLLEGSRMWLIDVRAASSFETIHIEGAVNIPHSILAMKRFSKNKMLVLVDNSLGQQNALKAAEALAASGHERVFVMSGGLRAWLGVGYPLIGKSDFELAKIMPNELRNALAKGIAVVVHDLRDAGEAEKYPLATGSPVNGIDFEVKLSRLAGSLRKSTSNVLGENLASQEPTVLVFPAKVDALKFYKKYLWDIQGDVRVMEGGFLASPDAREKVTVSNKDGCPTCPGSQAGGVRE